MLDYTIKITEKDVANELLIGSAPAALSQDPAPTVSNKYGFINSSKAVDILADYGFFPVHASQQRSHKKENNAFAAHLIRFESLAADDGGHTDLDIDGTKPQIILLNSHNKRTSLGLGQGFFRYACSNNLVFASNGVFSRLRHNQATVAAYEDIVKDKVKSLPSTMETIRKMVETPINTETAQLFARQACSLRGWQDWDTVQHRRRTYSGRNQSYHTPYTIAAMIKPRRQADLGRNLYTIFNMVQENFCNGLNTGYIPIVSTSKKCPEGRVRSARAITAIQGNTKLNAGLFELANKFMQAA